MNELKTNPTTFWAYLGQLGRPAILGSLNEGVNENNYEFISYQHIGGSIISGASDIIFSFVCQAAIYYDRHQFVIDCKQLLSQIYEPQRITNVGNDLLLDGKKIMGAEAYDIDKNRRLFVSHFSMEDMSEDVKRLCQAPLRHEPGFIDCDPNLLINIIYNYFMHLN